VKSIFSEKSDITILKVHALPPDLEGELTAAANLEGFRPIQWLRDEWEAGANRFSLPGEAFYTARMDGRPVGVCGVNQDPFAQEVKIARLRRLYVIPELRRKGVGRQLVKRALEDAVKYFEVIRLRTVKADSAAFFEAAGFTKVKGDESATHLKVL
jgi:N-acetylglutamate synthase-like GNAT family acetyltransferase